MTLKDLTPPPKMDLKTLIAMTEQENKTFNWESHSPWGGEDASYGAFPTSFYGPRATEVKMFLMEHYSAIEHKNMIYLYSEKGYSYGIIWNRKNYFRVVKVKDSKMSKFYEDLDQNNS